VLSEEAIFRDDSILSAICSCCRGRLPAGGHKLVEPALGCLYNLVRELASIKRSWVCILLEPLQLAVGTGSKLVWNVTYRYYTRNLEDSLCSARSEIGNCEVARSFGRWSGMHLH